MAAKQDVERHNPDQVAQVAAMLLQGRHDAEPHHVKAAVVTAKAILDEAHGRETEAEEAEVTVAEEAEVAAEIAAQTKTEA